jgi:hypothetical protein
MPRYAIIDSVDIIDEDEEDAILALWNDYESGRARVSGVVQGDLVLVEIKGRRR